MFGRLRDAEDEQIKLIIMIYAPVCIPTLNRYEHLRKCLESLSKCTWADQTEVYVALDYPPLDKWDLYAPGWEKNREFLHSCGDMGFKKLHLIEREENYGIWNSKRSNMRALVEEVIKPGQAYISSEDDNVFAPAFLDYMNKALELFKDDQSVESICGYSRYSGVLSDGNTYFRNPFYCSAWGCASWADRREEKGRVINYKYFRQSLSIRNLKKAFSYGRNQFLYYLSACCPTNRIILIDNTITSYMMVENKVQIIPVVSLVRNIGTNSGENFSTCNDEIYGPYFNQQISEAKTFDFIGTGYECQDENRVKWRTEDNEFCDKYYWTTKKVLVRKTIKYAIKIILGYFGWMPKQKN